MEAHLSSEQLAFYEEHGFVQIDNVLSEEEVGELAEATIALPELPATPSIPNAAVQNVGGKVGVWKVGGEKIKFVIVQTGASDLDGTVQIVKGLQVGDEIVVHSASRLAGTSRIRVTGDPAELLK